MTEKAMSLTAHEAASNLTTLGFSEADVPGMLGRARRMSPLAAAGLTGIFHVGVTYRSGRYGVSLTPLAGCACGYCRMTDRLQQERRH